MRLAQLISEAIRKLQAKLSLASDEAKDYLFIEL